MDKVMDFLIQTPKHDDLLSSARDSLKFENQQISPMPQEETRKYDALLKRLDSKPSAREILSEYCA